MEMCMTVYEIPGIPIALKRHRHTGKRCYDIQKKEKDNIVLAFLASFKEMEMDVRDVYESTTELKLTIEYHMPIPKSYSNRKAAKCLGKAHHYKPDLSNLIKFTEDVFNGYIWKDDSLISEIKASKFYSKIPKTVFKIEKIKDKIFESKIK